MLIHILIHTRNEKKTTRLHEGGGGDRLTHNESHLASGVLITTGHHGSHCVVHHSHKVQIKFLRVATNVTLSYSGSDI